MSKARQLADLGNVYDDGALSNRNLIINGAMQVAQRGTSATGRSSNGYYASDRFQMAIGSLGTWDISQETDSPEGFSNSFKVEAATAVTSPSAGGLVFLTHKFEGQNLQHLKKGTTNALPITLSFWIKSNVTGTYQVNIRDQDNVRYISATYTVNTSGTWEYKTITFAGDTTGILDNDNNESMRVEWWLASGSNFTSGALDTNWAAANNVNRNAGSNVNLASAVGNNWLITGVQLEVGDTATPFEHRSYGDELQRCKRYYEVTDPASASDPVVIGSGLWYSTGSPYLTYHYSTKRANPTVSAPTVTSGYRFYLGGNYKTVTSLTFQRQTPNCVRVSASTSGATTGHGCWGEIIESDAKIEIDAEL